MITRKTPIRYRVFSVILLATVVWAFFMLWLMTDWCFGGGLLLKRVILIYLVKSILHSQ